jgi:cell division protein FtsQ
VDRSFALPLPRRLPTLALPRGRKALALGGVLAALVLLGGAWLWLRNSPLAAVEHVHVSGAHGRGAHAVDMALEEAAMRMSTLNVNVGALRAAVVPFPEVRGVKVSASFPHTLRIRVIEQPPVAALLVGGVRTAVAADGAVLGSGLLSSSLPVVPGAIGDPLGRGHVHSAAALAALAVMGAALPALAGWVVRVYSGRQGLTVAMRNGLQLYFGDGTRPHAKWLAAARVLADPSSAGAWYVDVRLPERPAVGLSHAAAGEEGGARTAGAPTQVSASDPTAAALAATLAEAVNGGSTTGSTGAAATGAGAPTSSTEASTPSSTGASTPSAPAPTPGVGTATTEASTFAPTGASEAPTSSTSPAGPASGG